MRQEDVFEWKAERIMNEFEAARKEAENLGILLITSSKIFISIFITSLPKGIFIIIN